MEAFLSNEMDFLDDLDIDNFSSLLGKNDSGYMQATDQSKTPIQLDFIDDFLNLTENKAEVGIYVEPSKVQVKVVLCGKTTHILDMYLIGSMAKTDTARVL